ncbi:hypothetical protein ACSBR2_041757 [Camellia fascicularis]
MAAPIPSQTSLSKTNKEESDERTESVERSYKRYKEVISTLPKERGWLTEHLSLYQGFWYQPTGDLEGVMFVQEHFKARPTDVLLISIPKSGTTWRKAVIFAIMKRTCYNNSTDHPLLYSSPHNCIPFLEFKLFGEPPIADVENMPSARLFATHIPYTSLLESVLTSGCRIVYVCRNPNDVFVSMWHFMSKLREKNLPPAFTGRGIFPYGPLWDHVLGSQKASLECPRRVLFLRYKDMKMEPLVHVKRLAEFFGQPFSLEEENEGVVQEILKLCSFENLSKLEANTSGTYRDGIKNSVFFREGKVGDFSNHLTAQMIKILDQMTNEKFGGVF